MVATVSRELIELERGFWQALVDRDPDYFRHSMADDGVVIMPMGVMDKAACLRMIEESLGQVNAAGIEDEDVRELSEDTLRITYRGRMQGETQGQSFDMPVYGSTVYAQRHGQWLAVFHRETPIQQSW